MIEFAKILDIESNKLEVQMRTGECLFAPIIVTGVGNSLPSKDWVDNHKDQFLAVVAFEKSLGQNPMIIGFYPVSGADSSVYGVNERLLTACITLLDKLLNAKVNTSIGPQPFMPDTSQALNDIKKELEDIQKLIEPFK